MRFLVLPILVLLSSPAVAADYLGKVLAVSDVWLEKKRSALILQVYSDRSRRGFWYRH
jgi:hypothetical protein